MATSARPRPDRLESAGFFTLRTPLLPIDEFVRWGDGLEASSGTDLFQPGEPNDQAAQESAFHQAVAPDVVARDRERLRARLSAALTRPEVAEALYLASPELESLVDTWRREPNGDYGRRIERALVAYFSRMTGRATPFGLFAGCSYGAMGSHTRLAIRGRGSYRRRTRLSVNRLLSITETLERDPVVRPDLLWFPNPSVYCAAGQVRYARSRITANGEGHSYSLEALEQTDYLLATLERARYGAHLETLARPLTNDDVSEEEARAFIEQLIDAQVLVSDLPPEVTGSEPTESLIEKLRERASTCSVAAQLDRLRSCFSRLDAQGCGAPRELYVQSQQATAALPVSPEIPQALRVDLVKPGSDVMLGPQVIAEITQGVRALYRLADPAPMDALADFRVAFAERYGTRCVPLLEVLDEDIGIGFPEESSGTGAPCPLLDDIILPVTRRRPTTERSRPEWRARQDLLLDKLIEALRTGSCEITISEQDLDSLGEMDRPPLPDAFDVTVCLSAACEHALASGDFLVFIAYAFGPPGARLAGRFSYADVQLRSAVESYLRAEAHHRPDCVFAEIVYLPEGKEGPEGASGNLVLRPVMRDYEIPVLCRSGAPHHRQIPLTDLRVSIEDDRIVLRSERLSREVIPRLTNAHNHHLFGVAASRFLGALQYQGVTPSLSWNWGSLASAPFLPRVRSRKVVLARAQWNLRRTEIESLARRSRTEHFAATQALRRRRRLPRYVVLVDGESTHIVDLDNVLSVESLIHRIKLRWQATLVEMFPSPEQLVVRGPEGRYVHELSVPLVRRSETAVVAAPGHRRGDTSALRRRLPPGEEWLYMKLYTGTATADRLLRDCIDPLMGSLRHSGAVDRWFFIRYGDPEWHVRVRFHGQADRLREEVQHLVRAAVAPFIDNQVVWRVQFDTYEREVERYGGAEGVLLAERLFNVDSDAVIKILSTLPTGGDTDMRWQLGLLGVHALLSSFGLEMVEKRRLVRHMRDALARQLRAPRDIHARLAQKFRELRPSVELLVENGLKTESSLLPGLAALYWRSQALTPIAAELNALHTAGHLAVPLPSVVWSYCHMHVNRLLRSQHRAHELVFYDMLDRVYLSQLARHTGSESVVL